MELESKSSITEITMSDGVDDNNNVDAVNNDVDLLDFSYMHEMYPEYSNVKMWDVPADDAQLHPNVIFEDGDSDTANNDEDDDYEDNINVSIRNPSIDEIKAFYKDQEMPYINQDIQLQSEINEIIRKSIQPKTHKLITAMYQKRLITIESTQVISPRLTNVLWGPPLPYMAPMRPNPLEILTSYFKKMQRECGNCEQTGTYCNGRWPVDETFGIIAAVYSKTTTTINTLPSLLRQQQQQQQQQSSNILQQQQLEHAMSKLAMNNPLNDLPQPRRVRNNKNNGNMVNGAIAVKSTPLYRYYDFTLLIVRNGEVLNYAIHGHHSNFASLINEYQPRQVFCNAIAGDSLDTFLRYEYQPFYSALSGRLRLLKLNLIPLCNYISFCYRRDSFCSFCQALRYLNTFILVTQEQDVLYDSERPPPASPEPSSTTMSDGSGDPDYNLYANIGTIVDNQNVFDGDVKSNSSNFEIDEEDMAVLEQIASDLKPNKHNEPHQKYQQPTLLSRHRYQATPLTAPSNRCSSNRGRRRNESHRSSQSSRHRPNNQHRRRLFKPFKSAINVTLHQPHIISRRLKLQRAPTRRFHCTSQLSVTNNHSHHRRRN